MRKLLTISIVMLAVCTQATAQEPADLIAVADAADKALNAHDLDAMLSYWADDSIFDFVPLPAPLNGKDEIRAFFEETFVGFPDFGTTEGRVLAAGNTVVVEHSTKGTHLGVWNGIPPTGNTSPMPHIDIYEFEGDKVKRITTYSDLAGVMIQLGVVPAPEMPELVPSFALPDAEPTGLTPLAAEAEAVTRWNSRDLAHYAKMFHPDAEFFLAPAGVPMDKNAYIAMHEMYLQAFSDRQAEILRTVDLGDGWVMSEVVFTGTHTGLYGGVPATGNLFRLRGATLHRSDADGLLTNINVYYDNMTLMTQITTAPWPLDGIWITSAPTPFGNLISKTLYVSQDAAKTQYSGTLEFINAFPLFTDLYPDSDPSLGFSAGGQAVMVGRNRYEATYLLYDRKFDESTGVMEIVGIDTLKAYFEVVGPNQIQGHGTASYYMAAQDTDQDGFPDEGEEPVACFPWEWTSKRLTAMPGCELPPMPEPGQ